MNVELIVAGISNPGPKNTNVAFTVDGNGIRREAWILERNCASIQHPQQEQTDC
jgi:hypothetical protein